MSVTHVFAALYASVEILATMDADLNHRLAVVYRRALRGLDVSEGCPPAIARGVQDLCDRLARHDAEGAAGAIATRVSRLEGLSSQELEDLARQVFDLYLDMLLGGRSGAAPRP